MSRAYQQALVRTGIQYESLPAPNDLLLCPGIDVDKFKRECVAPIFPNMWNHWRLYRTTRDNPTDEEVKATALGFMLQIFKAFDMGKVRHEDITVVPIDKQPGENPWNAHIVRHRGAGCLVEILLGHSDYAPGYRTVYVRFVYRGSRTTIPWPVRKVRAGFASWCPQDADWILDTIFAPSPENVPNEKDDPLLPGAVGQGLPDAPKLDLGTKVALWGVGIVVAAGVLGYAVRSVR